MALWCVRTRGRDDTVPSGDGTASARPDSPPAGRRRPAEPRPARPRPCRRERLLDEGPPSARLPRRRAREGRLRPRRRHRRPEALRLQARRGEDGGGLQFRGHPADRNVLLQDRPGLDRPGPHVFGSRRQLPVRDDRHFGGALLVRGQRPVDRLHSPVHLGPRPASGPLRGLGDVRDEDLHRSALRQGLGQRRRLRRRDPDRRPERGQPDDSGRRGRARHGHRLGHSAVRSRDRRIPRKRLERPHVHDRLPSALPERDDDLHGGGREILRHRLHGDGGGDIGRPLARTRPVELVEDRTAADTRTTNPSACR